MPCHPPARPTRRRLLLATLLLPLALATGCASTVTTQVTPFHDLANERSGGLQGQRFVILPTPEQQSSLEFGAYADLVRQALVDKGLVDAGDDLAGADLGASMSYEVIGRGGGATRSTTGSVGFGAGSGGFSRGGIGIGIGFPIGGGSSGEVNFQRTLHVRIDRLRGGKPQPASPAPDPASPPAMPGPATRVFEARAISEGPSASIAPVMRAMVQAIFDGFPGESGRTRVVSVPMEEAR
jgi:hypothetical protein